MVQCQRGFLAEGIEPSHNGQEKDGLKIFKGLFTQFKNGCGYDAITAWAVLEHVHDPRSYFKKASELLSDEGVFIFMIPNFESLASRRLFAEDIPRHLYLFTRNNIRRYAEDNGFRVELVDQSNPIFVHDPHRAINYLLSKISGKEWKWPPPAGYSEFLKSKGLKRGIRSLIRFSLLNPIGCLDRVVAPFWGRYERTIGKYMVSVYVLRKSKIRRIPAGAK